MENCVKRERSTNFSKSEVRLLTELVANHRTIIENKKTDAITNKEKEATWNKIASLFNAASGFTARGTKSLKLKYESIKKETKKSMATHRQQLYKTGGGPSSGSDFTEIEEKVMAICSNMTGLDARNDSDNIQEQIQETPKVIIEELPLETLNNKMEIILCDDDGPVTLLEKDFCLPVQKENINSEGNDEAPLLTASQPMQVQDMVVEDIQKENNWSSWNPKALKTKINPTLKAYEAHKKSNKAGVTAKLDQLTKDRLELVALQKEIALKEHEFKMLSMRNDEQRKQEIHELIVRQLSNSVQTNILDINK